MRLRSLLFVPADSEKKLQKIDGIAADLMVLDLEDAVLPARKSAARQLAHDYLVDRPKNRKAQLWVRINPISTPDARNDLEKIMAGRPDGIVQPKTRSPDDVIELGQRLNRMERELGIEIGSTRILPIVTETPQAMFSLGQFSRCGRRLAALTWGAEDLSAAIGAMTNKDGNGDWTFPFQVARALCLFAASAAAVPAIDTLFADFRDPGGLRAACDTARRDGFSGKMAIHPAQIDLINQAFTPSAEEIAHAQRVIDAFAAQPEAGVLALDGQMLDVPHLLQARKILRMAEE